VSRSRGLTVLARFGRYPAVQFLYCYHEPRRVGSVRRFVRAHLTYSAGEFSVGEVSQGVSQGLRRDVPQEYLSGGEGSGIVCRTHCGTGFLADGLAPGPPCGTRVAEVAVFRAVGATTATRRNGSDVRAHWSSPSSGIGFSCT